MLLFCSIPFADNDKKEQIVLVLDLPSILNLALQKNEIDNLDLETSQRFLLAVSNSYLNLYYYSKCYQIAFDTKKHLKQFTDEEFPFVDEFAHEFTEAQIYLQELLNLKPGSLPNQLSFVIQPLLDDLEVSHQEIWEKILNWEQKSKYESELAQTIQKRITEIIMGHLLFQKRNKNQQNLEEQLPYQKFLLPKVIGGIKSLGKIQIQMNLLQLEYKKLVLIFHFKSKTLVQALHLTNYDRLSKCLPLWEIHQNLNKPTTKEKLEELIQKLETLLKDKETPKQEAYTLLARAHYYLGTFFYNQEDRKERLRIYKKGKDYGVLGARENIEIANALDQKKPWREINPIIKFEDSPAIYWMCGNWSRYGDAQGMSAAKDAPIIKDIAVQISKLNPFIDGSGAFRFLGVYYCRIPKVMGQDPKIAFQYFQRAIQQSPKFLGNKLLLAEYYCPLVEDETLYEKLCHEILKSKNNSFHPDWVLENSLSRKKAKLFLTEEYRENFF